jgi:hypothetical protein
MFASCANCGVRFHMRPGATAWTCPECGHEHGSATMGDLATETGAPDRAPAVPVARHAAPPRQRKIRRPPTRARLTTIAAIGIAAVLVIAFALSSLGAEPSATPSPTQSDTTSPSGSVAPIDALCLHLRDLQTPREDSLTRLAATLHDDAAAIQADGQPKLADAVRRMSVAVLAYRDALAAKGDTTQAGVQVTDALADLPC